MPRMKTESWGTGNFTWIASSTLIHNNRSAVLTIAAFTKATHYPEGYLPSGLPLAVVNGRAVPYTAGATDGSQVLAGHLFTDQEIDEKSPDTVLNIPLYDDGKVYVNRVPGPEFAAPDAANDKTKIIYL